MLTTRGYGRNRVAAASTYGVSERPRLRLTPRLSQQIAVAANQGRRTFQAQVIVMLEDWLRQHGPCGSPQAASQGEG
jgi:hypothetical protein